MFWLLLSNACPVLGIFVPLARGTLHSIKCSATTAPHTPNPRNKQCGELPSKGAVAWRLGSTTWWVVGFASLVCCFSPHLPIHLSLIKPSLSPPMSFLTSFSASSCCGGREQVAVWMLSCCRGSFHNQQEEKGGEKKYSDFSAPEWSRITPVVRYLVHWNCSTGDAHVLGLAGFGFVQTRNVVSAFLL